MADNPVPGVYRPDQTTTTRGGFNPNLPPMKTRPDRPCPEGAALIIKGEWFPCDFMDQMSKDSETHDGWPHGSKRAEAIWR